MASLAIAASGVTLAGIGIGTMMQGEITAGTLGLTVGSAITAAGGNLAMGEIQAYADLTAKAAERQYQIDQLP